MSNEPNIAPDDDDGLDLSQIARPPAAKFEEIGASTSGVVVKAEQMQQTDYDDGTPEFWPDGRPKMQVLVVLQHDDGELSSLYLRGGRYEVATGKGTSSETALVSAVRAAGEKRIRKGARLTMTHTGLGKPTKKSLQPPKLYTITYQPPEPVSAVDGLFSS